MISFEKPEGFEPKYSIAGVFVIIQGEVLLVKRSYHEAYEPGVWGIPAGSLEKDEYHVEAAMRETQEEVGLILNKDQLEKVVTVYQVFEKTKATSEFTIFKVIFDVKPEVKIDLEEHDGFAWVKFKDLPKFEQLEGNEEIFEYCVKQSLIP